MNQKLIYDIGMNNGDDTAYYLARGFDVVSIEADPVLCASAAHRFSSQIQAGKLTILNVAIASEPGLAEFWICEENSVWNSFCKEVASRDGLRHHSVQVQCETLPRIITRHGVPYFLKVDIEGNDFLCLDALIECSEKPQFVSLELGEIDVFLDKLTALGYSGFKLISQFNFLPVERPASQEQLQHERWKNLAASRNLLVRALRKLAGAAGREWMTKKIFQTRYEGSWFFPEGSSGPFGEQTPGRWLPAEEASRVYQHYAALARANQPGLFWQDKSCFTFWVDLHARR